MKNDESKKINAYEGLPQVTFEAIVQQPPTDKNETADKRPITWVTARVRLGTSYMRTQTFVDKDGNETIRQTSSPVNWQVACSKDSVPESVWNEFRRLTPNCLVDLTVAIDSARLHRMDTKKRQPNTPPEYFQVDSPRFNVVGVRIKGQSQNFAKVGDVVKDQLIK